MLHVNKLNSLAKLVEADLPASRYGKRGVFSFARRAINRGSGERGIVNCRHSTRSLPSAASRSREVDRCRRADYTLLAAEIRKKSARSEYIIAEENDFSRRAGIYRDVLV